MVETVTLVEQVTLIGQLKDVILFPVEIANKLLSIFSPNEVLILFVISLVIGFFLKNRYKTETVEFVIISLMVFFAFRFILGV